MTADIKLLPLPDSRVKAGNHLQLIYFTGAQMVHYARDNVDHATEALKAENEALRSEVDRWKSNYNEAIELKGRAFAESDRMAEMLREAQPFIGWIGNYDELHAKIDATLARQTTTPSMEADDLGFLDQEVGNG